MLMLRAAAPGEKDLAHQLGLIKTGGTCKEWTHQDLGPPTSNTTA